MQTERVGPDALEQLLGGAPQQGLALPGRASAVIFVNRTATGETGGRDSWNRSYGLDGRAGDRRGSHRQRLCSEDADTRTVRARSRLQLGIRIPPPRIQLELQLHGGRRRLQPEVGFLERPDGYRQWTGGYFKNVRNDGLAGAGIREWRRTSATKDFGASTACSRRRRCTSTTHGTSRTAFSSAPRSTFSTKACASPSRSTQASSCRPASYGESARIRDGGGATTASGFQAASAGRLGRVPVRGARRASRPRWTMRHGGTFTSSLRWTRTTSTCPQGAFVTNLGSLRTDL